MKNATPIESSVLSEQFRSLLGKLLLGTATPNEITELNKVSKRFVNCGSEPERAMYERFGVSEAIMEMLVAEGSKFSTEESAELRSIFFHSRNPHRTLAIFRKVKKLV